MTDTGPLFQPMGTTPGLCGGRLTARRFQVALTGPATERLALALARAYMPPHRYTQDPAARVAKLLPTDDRPRKADFGEFLCHLLYEQIFGHQIPFSRLWAKVAPNAIQQGADSVSVLVNPAEPAMPFTTEVKVRTGATGSGELLGEIADSVTKAQDPTYLAAAWSAGLDKLDAHPNARKAYAYSAAHHLALLDGTPPEELPPHEHHAVIITDGADITRQTIERHWVIPPVSALSIVKIPDLGDLIATVFSTAAELTARDLSDVGAPDSLMTDPDVPALGRRGLLTPIDPADLAAWQAAQTGPMVSKTVLESALWYLAGHDGIARARALSTTNHPDPTTRALADLLIGRDRQARDAARRDTLDVEVLLDTISDVLEHPTSSLRNDRDRIVAAGADTIAAVSDPGLRLTLSYVVEAVSYRLPRQPLRFLRAAGVTGDRVERIGRSLYRQGIHAFWPSQTEALEAGLLSQPPAPFAMRVPTSGGKTVLIGLAAANALDHRPGTRIIVLTPTRALVNQLRDDLSRLFADEVQVLGLHGELELGDEAPRDIDQDLITVMTPERFDLDWRRAATVEDLEPLQRHTTTVIVDEAHYLADPQRGARLELALSRVQRAHIPIILASSQLGQLPALADWIKGNHATSDWQPAHHIRQAYYRQQVDPETGDHPMTHGILIDESHRTEHRLTLTTKQTPPNPAYATTRVADQAAALATQFSPDGPVVLFSATKRNIPAVVDALYERVRDQPPANIAGLRDLADQLPEKAAAERDLILAGIGVHHRAVRQQFRRLVEHAARHQLLRYLVCTSTLLEGVDFPTRTVVMAYPQHSQTPVAIGDLRNLEGRAGRGGQHTSGRIVIFTPTLSKARHMLAAFRAQLPPTKSQLAQVAYRLRRQADQADLGPLEGFLLAAIAEAALEDGDLRNALEQILGRSLFFASLNDVDRDAIIAAAERRARTIRSTHPTPWLTVVYRTGLPHTTCTMIRNRLEQTKLAPLLATLPQLFLPSSLSSDDALRRILSDIVLDTPELRWPTDIDTSQAPAVIEAWLAGLPSDRVVEDTDTSSVIIERAFDALSQHGPWLVGAAIEVVGYLSGLDHKDRAALHEALELDRLRTGTNSLPAAYLVTAEAFDRHDASTLWSTYMQHPTGTFEEWLADATRPEV